MVSKKFLVLTICIIVGLVMSEDDDLREIDDGIVMSRRSGEEYYFFDRYENFNFVERNDRTSSEACLIALEECAKYLECSHNCEDTFFEKNRWPPSVDFDDKITTEIPNPCVRAEYFCHLQSQADRVERDLDIFSHFDF